MRSLKSVKVAKAVPPLDLKGEKNYKFDSCQFVDVFFL